MPARVLTPTETGQLFVLTLSLPGLEETPAGVLLLDPRRDELYLRLRRDWDQIVPVAEEIAAAPIADPGIDDASILRGLEADLETKALELGAGGLLAYLEETLSNTLRISEPRRVLVADFERELQRHYHAHVASTPRAFVTHLPQYSLAVAAGSFLENPEVEQGEWIETPPELRLTEDMFVARIAGQSMEPRIPDGSLCVFKKGVTGSRQGRLVLVEELGGGANDRYTVKRYRSVKRDDSADDDAASWSHEEIWLEPLNPAFEAWKLDPDEERYRILAEFITVLY